MVIKHRYFNFETELNYTRKKKAPLWKQSGSNDCLLYENS